MKRLVFFAAAHMLMLGAAWAQKVYLVSFDASPCGKFYVDGQLYDKAASFLWPEGSRHVFSAAYVNYPISTGIQCATGGWAANPTSAPDFVLPPANNVIYVGPDTIAYKLSAGYLYELQLRIEEGGTPPLNCKTPDQGSVLVNGTCYDHSTRISVPAGPVPVAAYPPPGWSFLGWGYHVDDWGQSPRVTIPVNGPTIIQPLFRVSSTLQIMTDPPGMKVMVDRTIVDATTQPPNNRCPNPASRCFDWLPGSVHALSPVTPQDRPLSNDHWAFVSWSDGGPENRSITMPSSTTWVKLTAKYGLGARVGFNTVPPGLQLTVDGRTNWPSYSFFWAIGSKHKISAPSEQTDGNGRRYTFRQWVSGGAAEQDYIVAPVGKQPVMTAVYDVQGQLVINSPAVHAQVLVDGSPCATPCAVNRAPGTNIKISAPQTVAVGDAERLDFQGWADGGPAERVWKAANEGLVLTANYRTSYRVLAVSDPVGGSAFLFDPPSADGFYSAGANVSITAQPKPGYKFRVWDGAFQTAPSIRVRASAPLRVLAVLDSYPYLGVEGVRNAAAETPEPNVAPGSIIAITGANLAPASEKGPENPLAQAIAGVTVQVDNRYLPLLAVTPELITAQLYSDFTPGEHVLTVHQDGQPDVSTTFKVKRNAPGLFASAAGEKQYALALHDDGTPVTPESPAQHGETITLLGTGFGPARPAPLDGFVLPVDPKTTQYSLVDPVEIRAGDKTVLQPVSSQAAKGYIGIAAIRLKITEAMPAGTDVELRAAVKDPADREGKTFHLSNKVLLPLK